MIVKPIEIPEFLQQLEALDGRLFKKHEKKELVGKQLTYRRTGYYGEKSVEFPQAVYRIRITLSFTI